MGNLRRTQRGTTGSPRQHLRRAPNAHYAQSLPRARRVHIGPSPPQGPTGGSAEVEGQPGPQAQPERTGLRATLPWPVARPVLPWSRTAPSRAQLLLPQMPRCALAARRPPPPAAAAGGAANQASVTAQVPSLTTWHRRTAQPGMTQDPPAPGQTGGEPARSGPWSPLEALLPDWPQAHTLALTPKRPAKLRCPPAWILTGASAASPQQGGPPHPLLQTSGSTQVQGSALQS